MIYGNGFCSKHIRYYQLECPDCRDEVDLHKFKESAIDKLNTPATQPIGAGRKDDSGKLARYDLIPPHALHALAELYGTGARKYADRNWEKGMAWGRIFRALIGHAMSWVRGESYDPDDKQHHLISVAWNAFALYEYERRKVGEDNVRIIK